MCMATKSAARRTVDTRIRCPICDAVTWQKEYVKFMKDHDRPRGGRCLKGAELVAVVEAEK